MKTLQKVQDKEGSKKMTDRRKTALILGTVTLIMFSPLAMSLFGHPIPMFQNLGFERETIAPPLAWILATIIAIAYVLYTMKAIPLVLAKQREISLFKLLGILSALVGGIVEEVFFRRWTMDMFMKGGFNPILQVIISGVAFGLAHWSWTLLAKRDFKATLPAILSTSILGIFLAIIYLAGGRNLGPCIFAHVLINIVIEPWLMLSAVSGKWRSQHRLHREAAPPLARM
ncbi:MAG TPA: CPBP family intramembrane glutamic endopeptidase [Anaerolineales bacterium]